MDEVCLSLSALENIVREMKRRQLDHVRLSIAPAEDDLPASLTVEGLNVVRPSVVVNVDDLESDPAVESLFSAATVFTNIT